MRNETAPGHVFGKAGVREEERCVRAAFSTGRIAIRADLTNCIRKGDIIVCSESTYTIRECKSSKRRTSRWYRQMTRIQAAVEFLNTDQRPAGDACFLLPKKGLEQMGIHGPVQPELHVRVDAPHCRLHRSSFNTTVGRLCSRQQGTEHVVPEQGVHYFMSYATDPEVAASGLACSRSAIPRECVIAIMNTYSRIPTYLAPFCLLFEDPQAYVEFLCDRLFILVAVEIDRVRSCLRDSGLSAEKYSDEGYIWRLSDSNGVAFVSQECFETVLTRLGRLDDWIRMIAHVHARMWDDH